MFRVPFAVSAIVVLLSLLGACVQPPPLVVYSATGDVVPLEPWSADLIANAPPESSALRGSVRLVPGNTIRETRAVVALSGGAPNAVHPWYVQLGECSNDRGILAGPLAYPPIALDATGAATATLTLPFTPPTSGRYFVSVRRSESDVGTVLACGNFVKAADASRADRGLGSTPNF